VKGHRSIECQFMEFLGDRVVWKAEDIGGLSF